MARREHTLPIRLNTKEWEDAKEIAHLYGLPVSAFFRLVIRLEKYRVQDNQERATRGEPPIEYDIPGPLMESLREMGQAFAEDVASPVFWKRK